MNLNSFGELEPITFKRTPARMRNKAHTTVKSFNNDRSSKTFLSDVEVYSLIFTALKGCFFVEKGFTCETDEPVFIHHCLYDNEVYTVAALSGWDNPKQKSFTRPDKLTLCEIDLEFI